MRDLAWAIMAAAICVMLISLIAPWERVHMEQETDGPIMERTWQFAPWGMVVDGQVRVFDHDPHGMDNQNRNALLSGVAALGLAVHLALIRPLTGWWQSMYFVPALLTIVASSAWRVEPLRMVCLEAAQAGRNQRCDTTSYSMSAFLILAAITFAFAAFLPRPDPPDRVLPELPDPQK